MIENRLEEKASKTSRFRYAIGMFGTSIPINMFKTFAPIYYVDQLGITTRQFSAVLTVTAVMDIFFVYLFGALSDRKASQKGRKKWILYGTPFLTLAFILFFNNQRIQESNSLFIYLFLLYGVVAILDGMININYGALFPELFHEQKDRIAANAYRQVCQLFAMILSMAGTPLLVDTFGYGKISVFYGVLAWAVISYSAAGYHEPERKVHEAKTKRINLYQVGKMLKEPLLWFYGGATLFYSIAFSLLTQGMPFYIRYTLQEQASMHSVLLFSIFLMTILSIFLFKHWTSFIAIENIWFYGFVLIAVGFLTIGLTRTISGIFIGAIIIGIGIGAMMTSSDIIGAKVIDTDLRKNKEVRTGLFMSFFNSMFRLNGLFVGIAYLLTEMMYGFISGEQPGEVPEQAATFLFISFPFVMILFGAILSYLFRRTLKKEEQTISRTI